MPRKAMFLVFILAAVLILSSCSSVRFTDPRTNTGAGDMIIPPESSVEPGLNANQRNVGNANNQYQQNIVNRLYAGIDADKIVDFVADENYIYVLENEGKTPNGINYGEAISVYGLEDSSLIRQIKAENQVNWISFAVSEGKVYAYDFVSGNISVFSTEGHFSNEIKCYLPRLYVEKMELDGGNRIFFKVDVGGNEIGSIFAVNAENGESFSIGKSDLADQLDYGSEKPDSPAPYIQDFCVYNDQRILIKVFPERLCLFNLNTFSIEKLSYIPDAARFIALSSGVLYYASGLKISVFSNNVANLSNEGSQNVIGRLLVNDKFVWSLDSVSLSPFQLGEVIIPYDEQNYQHVKMRQNNKYIFLLDSGTNEQGETGSRFIRIAK